jgi:hypothetical protein
MLYDDSSPGAAPIIELFKTIAKDKASSRYPAKNSTRRNLPLILEILVLRYQSGIVDRKLNRTIKPNQIKQPTLELLVDGITRAAKRSTNEVGSTLSLFSPRSVFLRHNELVKRKLKYLPHGAFRLD